MDAILCNTQTRGEIADKTAAMAGTNTYIIKIFNTHHSKTIRLILLFICNKIIKTRQWILKNKETRARSRRRRRRRYGNRGELGKVRKDGPRRNNGNNLNRRRKDRTITPTESLRGRKNSERRREWSRRRGWRGGDRRRRRRCRGSWEAECGRSGLGGCSAIGKRRANTKPECIQVSSWDRDRDTS